MIIRPMLDQWELPGIERAELVESRRRSAGGDEGFTKQVAERHAWNLDRVLEGEEQPGLGSLPRLEGEQIDAIEGDGAAEHLVPGLARQDVGERGLP